MKRQNAIDLQSKSFAPTLQLLRGKMANPVRTWVDLQGIKFKFLQHSNQAYSHIHDALNASYSNIITGTDYDSLFTTPAKDVLQNNCAKLLLDAIYELITARPVITAPPSYLDFIVSGM